MQWSWLMIQNHILQIYHVCVLHPSMGTLSIQFQFINPLTYYWGRIHYWIMKTLSEMWWSFSITIWWTLNIHKTCCLLFSFWIHPTYYCTLYIWCGKNTTSISIYILIFCIIKFSILMFWKNNHSYQHQYIFSIVGIYIFVLKFFTMMYKVKKYWFL